MANTRRRGKPAQNWDDVEEDFGGETVAAQPGPPETGNPLWDAYLINPNLPFRVKVEKLLLGWNLDAGAIAMLVGDEAERVQSVIDDLQDTWRRLGEGLNTEERKLARGKLIAELLELRSQVDSLNSISADYKHLQLKLTIMERIAKLQGIEVEKREVGDEGLTDPLENAVENMEAGQLAELWKRLSQEKA
jgi:hypothetical protein